MGKIPLSERDLQKAVIKLAQSLGWRVMHPLPAQTPKGGWSTATQGDGKGFPDLTLVRERVIFAELKTESKYLTPEQKRWRDWLQTAKAEWYCWKPAQWLDGSIDDILAVRLPILSVVGPRPIQNPERYARLLKACGGDEVQARRVYDAIRPQTRSGPTAEGPLNSLVPSPTEGVPRNHDSSS